MSDKALGGLSCREMGLDDLPAVIDLLHVGFPKRSRSYWVEGLQRLAAYSPPAGVPKFGYLLASGGTPVGVLLLMSSNCGSEAAPAIRSNVSSWYVQPDFRAYAPLLSSRATKGNAATYVNIWPATHTLHTIKAQGFAQVSEGLFASLPALGRMRRDVKISSRPEVWQRSKIITKAALQLLTDHQHFGCICLWCETSTGGRAFIFRKRLSRYIRLPCAMLIYADSLDELKEYAGPIGRFLALRGIPVVVGGSDRPLSWMVGKHFKSKMQIYCKGPHPPKACDLSYTEAAVFGL